MKIMHLNAFEGRGGAAIAAVRLHQGLLTAGMDSDMLVQFKDGDMPGVHGPQSKWSKAVALFQDTAEVLPQLSYRNRRTTVFSTSWLSSSIAKRVAGYRPDIVQLHWLHAGMASVADLGRFTQPLVWTMHDMWPFTGGCHYAGDCLAYQQQCGRCPQLGSLTKRDISCRTIERKRRNWQGLPITPVAPSQWLADHAAHSSLFADRDIRVIPNGLDLSRWRPVDRQQARQLLGLPDGPLLLFCAARGLTSPFKGGAGLLEILSDLHARGRRFTLVLMGDSALPPGMHAEFPVHALGKLHDDISKVLAYSAADVTLHTAEQENLPNTIAESLACGTPVIGNAVGGVPEMIDERDNGLLIPAGDHAAFARALAWYLDSADHACMSRAARRKAMASYDLAKTASSYRGLYEELLVEGGVSDQ